MEILNQLEQRINGLLERITVLSAENAGLKASQEHELSALVQENSSLRAELEKERNRASEAQGRIEALIERIKEHTDQE
jgi:Protein of unknown function (DUF904).